MPYRLAVAATNRMDSAWAAKGTAEALLRKWIMSGELIVWLN